MGIWCFWEQYLQALDDDRCPYYPGCIPGPGCTRCWEGDPLDRPTKEEVQRKVTTPMKPQLSRELVLEQVSRFLSSVRRMPKAWGSRPWTAQEMRRAEGVVANDLFRRKTRRDHLGPPRV